LNHETRKLENPSQNQGPNNNIYPSLFIGLKENDLKKKIKEKQEISKKSIGYEKIINWGGSRLVILR
jgi:hypothetical protein